MKTIQMVYLKKKILKKLQNFLRVFLNQKLHQLIYIYKNDCNIIFNLLDCLDETRINDHIMESHYMVESNYDEFDDFRNKVNAFMTSMLFFFKLYFNKIFYT